MNEENRANIAYIDSANLDKSLKNYLGWKLDYKKFRIWLSDKYVVKQAYLFIGYIPKYKDMYTFLQDCGFTLVFKDVVYQDGKTKGNCDSDLLMQAAKDFYEGKLDKAVLVASDGDYTPLVKMLAEKDAMTTVFSPAPTAKCSVLLKRTGVPIAYLEDQRSILEWIGNPKKKKPPMRI
jgi:uncharacterized LabA/DUF88 family protein